MIAASLLLSVIVLGVPAVGHDLAASMPAGRGVSPSRLVVPTGVAVPVARHDALPAPSDLFRAQRCDVDAATALVGKPRSGPAAGTS